MNKTKIEWCDYTINPVKGLCPMACSYCYARAMYKRFKWNPEMHYRGKMVLLNELLKIPRDKPQRIFVGSTFELFGDWVKPEWMQDIFELVSTFSFFTFIFLTKQPQNLIKWSPFPDNCWVGVSCATYQQYQNFILKYADTYEAKVKFISFEPLLEPMTGIHPVFFASNNINWLIIGRQTPCNDKTMPHVSDVQEIIQAADNANIPVFLKNNLNGFLPFRQYFKGGDNWKDVYSLRQEFPTP